MRITFDSIEDEISLEAAYLIENQTSGYFENLLIQEKHLGLLDNYNPFRVHIAVADRITTESATTITAAVSLLYKSKSVLPSKLENILEEALSLTNADSHYIAFEPDETTYISYEFLPGNQATTILDVQDNARSSTEIGLILATVFLSFILVVVSSVLLHITGGWSVFKSKLLNCLFEEVDEEGYDFEISQNKNVYVANTASEDEEEKASTMTSLPPDSASGILGVQCHPEARSGTRTNDEETSTAFADTPISQSSAPVGITSLRNMPKSGTPETLGGLSGIVMQRCTRNGQVTNRNLY